MAFIKTLIILSVIYNSGYSYPYGGDSAKRGRAVAADMSGSDVVGFDLLKKGGGNDNTSNGNGQNLLNNIQSLSTYSSSAYNNDNRENRLIEVSRISTNEVVNSRNQNNKLLSNNLINGNTNNNQNNNEINKSGSVGNLPLNKNDGKNTRINSATGLDPDAIVYPDSLFKYKAVDSYGNPVTPYGVLPDEPTSSTTKASIIIDIGHKTDVNKDSGVSGISIPKPKEPSVQLLPPSSHPETLGFILPSYASGITKLETYSSGTVPIKSSSIDIVKPQSSLLPPLSSGNFNFPELNKDSTKKPVLERFDPTNQSTQKPVTQQTQQRFGSDNSKPTQKVSSPSDSLLPPAVNAPSNLFNSNNKEFTSPGVIVVPPKSQLNTPTTSTTSFQPINSKPFPQLQVPQTTSQSKIGSTSSVELNKKESSNSQTSSKYTGGFGGAPGLLTPFNKPIDMPLKRGPTAPPPQPLILKPNTQKPTPTQVNSSSSNNKKYTGGFGGPPGILRPYDNEKKP